MYFPNNKSIDKCSKDIIDAFKKVEDEIDSDIFKYSSDEVLKKVCDNLEIIGF